MYMVGGYSQGGQVPPRPQMKPCRCMWQNCVLSCFNVSRVCMRYIAGAGWVYESLMIISQLWAEADLRLWWMRSDHLPHAKSPLIMMAGCYRFAAIDCIAVTISRVTPWLKLPEWLAIRFRHSALHIQVASRWHSFIVGSTEQYCKLTRHEEVIVNTGKCWKIDKSKIFDVSVDRNTSKS